MRILLYILLLINTIVFSQQTTQFTQFTFNKYGYNPAAAGSNINAKIEAIGGIRKQWVGFGRAPASNFFSVNYTFKPPRSYKRWHNAGVYVANDTYGLFQNFGIYGSYTLHLPLNKRTTMSFGIFGGIRRFSFSTSSISSDDPAGKNNVAYFWAYPDIIPGFRVYNKKMFFDVSIQQIYKNRQVQGNKQIGNKSKLSQTVYISFGRRFFFDNYFVVVPSFNLRSTYTTIPSAEFNLMAYYKKRIGIGASVRDKNFISGIVQVRLYKTTTIGFAYDYSLNKISRTSPHSVEFMFGVTPLMMLEGDKIKNSVAKCPTFDF
jgi:type IX secretion system PorP/SprF family membrane protein